MIEETHAIILTQGEDVVSELHKNMREGNLLTKLDDTSFRRMTIKNFKYIRMAEPHETEHRNNKSIWVEVTISF